jgi:hypothetical protein
LRQILPRGLEDWNYRIKKDKQVVMRVDVPVTKAISQRQE